MDYNKWLRAIGGALIMIAAVSLIIGVLTGCAPSGPIEQQPSPKDLWISAHPTHSDEKGYCREFDDELCDEDPYDLDDLWELDKTKKSSAKPKASPKPATTRRR